MHDLVIHFVNIYQVPSVAYVQGGGITGNHGTPDIAGKTSPFFLFFHVLTLQRGNLFPYSLDKNSS